MTEATEVNSRIVSVTVEAKIDGRFYYGEGTSKAEAEEELHQVLRVELGYD